MASRQSTPGYLYFLADFFNLVIEAMVYFASFAGPVTLLWFYRSLHPLALTLLGILGWLLAALSFTLILVFIKRVLIGEVPTGRFLLTSSRSYRWMASDRVVKMMTRSPFRSLTTENAFFRYLFYKGMGMRFETTLLIGPRAVIAEPWSMTVGHNVVIGADASLSGHKVEHQVVTLEPITIGNDTLIGTRAVILPGVTIGNRVVLGANSLVPRGTVIPDGETWAGNPAQRVGIFAGKRAAAATTTSATTES